MNRHRFMILAYVAAVLWTVAICPPALCGKPSNVRLFEPCPDEWLRDAREFAGRGLIPGALFLVESPEWGLRIGSVGFADISTSEPARPDMRFRIGGVTRIMLSAVILQLEHEGKLALDDTVDSLIGEGIVPNGHNITLRDCLTMQSGLFDYSKSDTLLTSVRHSGGGYLPEEVLYKVRESLRKQSFTPGDHFDYSDTGYLLAGIAAERIESKPLAGIFEERIFRPLGMTDSFFPANAGIPGAVVHGYENLAGVPVDCTEYDPSLLGASCGVVSTPFDTFRFFEDIFEGGKLLTKRSTYLMSTLANAARGEDSYGLGLLERVSERGTWRGCETSVRGYTVFAGYYMQGDAYIMVFVNTGENEHIAEELFRSTLRRISGCPCDYSPADGVRLDAGGGRVRLSWQAGFLYGDSYRVYVGADRASVRNADPGNLNGVTMIETDGDTYRAVVNGLQTGRTYFWRVETSRIRPEKELVNARLWRDEIRKEHSNMPWTPVSENESISGPVYSFTLR